MNRLARRRAVAARLRRSPGGVTGVAIGCLGLLASGCTGTGGSGNGGPAMATVLPGATSLSKTGLGPAVSLWCGSPGDCAIGGSYVTVAPGRGQYPQAYANSEVRGSWGRPQPIRGLASLLDYASLAGFSCASAGNCLAAGDYEPAAFPRQATSGWRAGVAREVNGTWDRATPVPGLAHLSHGENSVVLQLSCGRTGWCVLVGRFWPGNSPAIDGTPFVASEHAGAWRPAQLIAGLAPGRAVAGRAIAPAHGVSRPAIQAPAPVIGPLACDPEGSCTVAGARPGTGPFVVTEANGAWGRPQTISGDIGKLSCTSPGNCSGVGAYYADGYTDENPPGLRPWVITETNGRWGQAAPLPGTVTFHAIPSNQGENYPTVDVTALSCAAPGQCALAGYYASVFNGEYSGVDAAVSFVASQVNGKWRAPQEIPGPGAHGHAGIVEITALSCGSAGNCVAGGSYTYERVNPGNSDGTIYPQAFVLSEAKGVWGHAEAVQGLGPLGPKDSSIDLISCAVTGRGHGRTTGRVSRSRIGCTAIGRYDARAAEFGGLFAMSLG